MVEEVEAVDYVDVLSGQSDSDSELLRREDKFFQLQGVANRTILSEGFTPILVANLWSEFSALNENR